MSKNTGLGEELLGTVLATAPVGIVVVEPTTLRVLLANEQFRQYLDPKWHTRDLTGQSLDALIPGMSGEEARETLAQIMRTGEPLHFPEYLHTGFVRGETYWQRDLSPVTNASGMRVAAMYTAMDITAQVLARQETEATNAALASFVAISATITASLDFDEVMDRVIAAVVPLVPFERALVLLDDGPDHLRVVASRQTQGQPPVVIGTRVPKERSISGHVVRTGRALSVADVDNPALLPPGGVYRTDPPDENLGAVLCVPLVARGAAIGALFVERCLRYGYTEDHLHRLEQIAPQVASAVGNAVLYRTATEHARESETLSKVATAVAASLAQPDVLHAILDQIGLVVGYDQAQITTPERDAATLRVVSARGSDAASRVGGSVSRANRASARCLPCCCPLLPWSRRDETPPHRHELVLPLAPVEQAAGSGW